MRKLKNILYFVILPMIIIFLIIINAKYQAKIYSQEINGVDISQLKAIYEIEQIEYRSNEDQIISIPVEVTNTGTMTWLKQSNKPINLSYHILDENKKEYYYDGERTPLPQTIRSGESLFIEAVVKVPDESGTYYIEFDMVLEEVAWFSEKGSETKFIKLVVK